MKVDKAQILENIQKFFRDPVGLPNLPKYMVGTWKTVRDKDFKTAEELEEEKEAQGAIFNTEKLEDIRSLYFILRNPEVKDLRLYQITPERIIFLMEYLGVKG